MRRWALIIAALVMVATSVYVMVVSNRLSLAIDKLERKFMTVVTATIGTETKIEYKAEKGPNETADQFATRVAAEIAALKAVFP